jgi:hypothetical protein
VDTPNQKPKRETWAICPLPQVREGPCATDTLPPRRHIRV